MGTGMKNTARDVLIFWMAVAFFCITSWAFWHYLGADAGTVLGAMVVVGLLFENHRLRRKLKDSGSTQ